jgi:hypothetical protein
VNFNSDEATRSYGFIPPAGNYGALPATLKEDAELVQAIVDALMDALRKIQTVIDDPAAVRAMLPESFVRDISAEKWELQWNAVKGGFRSSTGGLTQDELESAVANFAASGIVKSGATIPGAVVTNRFVRDFWARSDHAAPDLPAEMADIHVQ